MYGDNPINIADINNSHGFLSPFKKNKVIKILKEEPTFASKATLENCIDQGEIANKKLDNNAK